MDDLYPWLNSHVTEDFVPTASRAMKEVRNRCMGNATSASFKSTRAARKHIATSPVDDDEVNDWSMSLFSSRSPQCNPEVEQFSVSSGYHQSRTTAAYCLAQPLRWIRIAAAGLHATVTDKGAKIRLPPRDTPWAMYPRFANGWRHINRTCGGVISSEEITSSAWKACVQANVLASKSPALVVPQDPARTISWGNVEMQPVGRSGPLGALGAVSIMVFGDNSVSSFSSEGHGYLELFAVVPRLRQQPKDYPGLLLEGVPTNSNESFSPPKRQEAPLDHSYLTLTTVDDGLLVFGAFRAAEDASGLTPSPRFSMGHLAVSKPWWASSPWTMFPDHPLVESYHRSHAPYSRESFVSDTLDSFQWSVGAESWGPNAGGFDLVFFRPDGFPQPIHEAARIARTMTLQHVSTQRTSPKSWLIITGGCLLPGYHFYSLSMCADYEALRRYLMTTSSEDLTFQTNEVRVFDPHNMMWLPRSIHRIPELNYPRSHHVTALVDDRFVVAALGTSLKIGKTDGLPFFKRGFIYSAEILDLEAEQTGLGSCVPCSP